MLRAKLEKLMAMAVFMMSLSSCAKAFSRGEGGAAPKQAFIYILALCKKNKRPINNKLCGAVTEEGKRCDSYIGRSAKGQVRFPSSVTLPQMFAQNKITSVPNRL